MNIGAGSIAHMISRFNENRNKLSKRPDARTRMRDRLLEGFKATRTDFYREDISPETLARVKGEICEKYRKERRRSIILWFVSLALTLIIFLLTWIYLTGSLSR